MILLALAVCCIWSQRPGAAGVLIAESRPAVALSAGAYRVDVAHAGFQEFTEAGLRIQVAKRQQIDVG